MRVQDVSLEIFRGLILLDIVSKIGRYPAIGIMPGNRESSVGGWNPAAAGCFWL